MAQLQNVLDLPPASKLNAVGRLDERLATPAEARVEKIFFGKGQCASCHTPPAYLDQQMHDLPLEKFLAEPPVGPHQTLALRGVKESSP